MCCQEKLASWFPELAVSVYGPTKQMTGSLPFQLWWSFCCTDHRPELTVEVCALLNRADEERGRSRNIPWTSMFLPFLHLWTSVWVFWQTDVQNGLSQLILIAGSPFFLLTHSLYYNFFNFWHSLILGNEDFFLFQYFITTALRDVFEMFFCGVYWFLRCVVEILFLSFIFKLKRRWSIRMFHK